MFFIPAYVHFIYENNKAIFQDLGRKKQAYMYSQVRP